MSPAPGPGAEHQGASASGQTAVTPLRRPLAARDLWLLLAGIAGIVLLFKLADVALLVFGGILLALALRLLANPLIRRMHLSPAWALLTVIVALLALLAAGSWLIGANVAEQVQALREAIPRAIQALQGWLADLSVGRWLLELYEGTELSPEQLLQVAGFATGTVNATVGAVGALVLLLALGVYLAADPGIYRRGFLRLLPVTKRAVGERLLDLTGHQLTRWMLGQGVSMLAVGVLTSAGLALVGLPLALPLGVIAGLFEFVPYFGPIASGLFIVAVALAEGETQALWAAGVCFAVQQIEAFVIQPLAQRWAVRLAPAAALLAVVIFGLLFGLPGVLLAVPLMVLTVTLAEEGLKLRDAKGTDLAFAAPTIPKHRARQ